MFCLECSQEVGDDASAGVFHHLDSDGNVDHDQDADHVPIPEEEEADPPPDHYDGFQDDQSWDAAW